MEIVRTSMAGTLESSDIQITLEPGSGGVVVELKSSVMNQYGRQIREVIEGTLEELGVSSAKVVAVDKGALDCTIKARVECAVYRAGKEQGKVAWGGVK